MNNTPVPGDAQPLRAGELVILTDRKRRRWMITLESGGQWHSHAGVVEHDDLIGQTEGTAVRSAGDMEVTALRPTVEDYVLEMPRGAQVVYRKDQAMILTLADIRPGCTVIEAGAGSGALSIALLQAVGSDGRVISYERREDHLAVAEANVARFFGGAPDTWQPRHGDVAHGLEDGLHAAGCDRIVLDLPEPEVLVGPAAGALRAGGLLVAYVPSVTQIARLGEELDGDERFDLPQTSETLHRQWRVAGQSVRPEHRMVAHTGFLTVVRRVLTPDEGGPISRRRSFGRRGW